MAADETCVPYWHSATAFPNLLALIVIDILLLRVAIAVVSLTKQVILALEAIFHTVWNEKSM